MKKKIFVFGLLIAAWFLLPTGDPTDLFLIATIHQLGFPLYLLIISIIIFLLWNHTKGNNLSGKLKSIKKF
jgi:hypothetical protein